MLMLDSVMTLIVLGCCGDVFIPTLRGRGRGQDQLLEAEELQAHDIRLDRDTQGVARQRVLKRITVLYTTLEVGSICVVLALVVSLLSQPSGAGGRGTSKAQAQVQHLGY